MAEELRFEQLLLQCAAVNSDKITIFPGTAVMYGLGYQFFSHAALALNKY